MLRHECTCQNSANHLETPERIRAIWQRVRGGQQRLADECELVAARVAPLSELLTCHSEQYALIFGAEQSTRAHLPRDAPRWY